MHLSEDRVQGLTDLGVTSAKVLLSRPVRTRCKLSLQSGLYEVQSNKALQRTVRKFTVVLRTDGTAPHYRRLGGLLLYLGTIC